MRGGARAEVGDRRGDHERVRTQRNVLLFRCAAVFCSFGKSAIFLCTNWSLSPFCTRGTHDILSRRSRSASHLAAGARSVWTQLARRALRHERVLLRLSVVLTATWMRLARDVLSACSSRGRGGKGNAAALKYDERHSEEQLAWLQLERARLRYEAEVDDTDDDDDEDDADDSDDECHEDPRRQGQTDEARYRDRDHPRRRDPLDDLNVSLRDPSISSAATATGERHRRRDPLDAPSVSLRDPSMCSAATTTSERVE